MALSVMKSGAALPAPQSNSDSDETTRPFAQLRGGKESRGWINDEEWRINIEETFDVGRLRSPSDVSIFRVPNFLKQSRKAAYVPNIVSLGPYHLSNPKLSPMERHKGRALSRMMTRFNINPAKDFSCSAKEEILKLNDEIRKTYEEKIDCDAKTFSRMLSLDEENLPIAEASNYYEPIFERNKIDYTGFHILSDILMRENQIPLIVLRKLLELELNSSDNVGTKLFQVLVKFPGSKFYPFKYKMEKWSWPQQQQQQVHHLLGLLHSLIVSPPCPDDGDRADQIEPERQQQQQQQPQPHHLLGWLRSLMIVSLPGDPDDVRRIPRAVELRNAGIKFERVVGGIEKIKFEKKNATIYLPPINITDYTEVLFRNLIALELCKPAEINYVTCYLSLMDELIDSEEDVAVLRNSHIVINYLGSDAEVAKLIDGLLNGVTLSRRDAFQQLKGQVHEHYKSKFKVWSAELVKEYFSSPWRSLALAGANYLLSNISI